MLVFLTQLWMEPKGNLQAHLQPGSASPLETHLFFFPYFLLPPNLAAGPSPAEGRRYSKTSFCQAGLYFCVGTMALQHFPLTAFAGPG